MWRSLKIENAVKKKTSALDYDSAEKKIPRRKNLGKFVLKIRK